MQKYREDRLTKVKILDSKIETEEMVTDLFFFITILLAPFKIIINDVYNNKFMHDNSFWIKRAKYYFIFIIIMYFFIYLFVTLESNVMLLSVILTYSLIFGVDRIHKNYRHIIEGEIGLYKPNQDEINRIAKLQKIDENEKNKIIKWYLNVAFLIVCSIVYYIVLMNIYILSGIVLFFMIVGYDIFIQKKFKRDITNLFWKKRVAYYLYLVVPFVFVVDGIIRDSLFLTYNFGF